MAAPKFDRDAVRQWLRILHGDSSGRIHIASTAMWSGPSFPTSDIDATVDRAAELDAARPLGVYVRMTTLAAPLGRGQRGGNADSLCLPALWADIDIAGAAHKEPNLPPDWAAAESIVASSGLPAPTVLIDSGHGMYPIWLLKPVEVLTGDNFVMAGALSADWQRVVAVSSERLGYRYGEGIGDLARVLRLPGTVNRKAGTERMCRLVPGGSGARYSLAELHERCAALIAQITPPPAPGRSGDAVSSSPPRPGPALRDVGPGEVPPGEDYAARTSWADILEPHGWRLVRVRGDIRDWCRPGKDEGISATTNGNGTDRFHCFSTSTEFDTTSYSKFGAYAVLNHGGDHSAAASALKAAGYGSDPTADIQAYLAGLSDKLPPMRGDPGPGAPSVEDSAQTPAEALDARTQAELRYRADVAAEARRVSIAWEGRRMAESERFRTAWREPPYRPSLAEELALPDPPIMYRVGKLLTVDGNAVLTAAFKSGKTTLCNNLLRCLADGERFLNRFDVTVPDGRIAAFNYEVSEGQYRSWLRKIGIRDQDRICVVNLRGFRLPLTDPHVEDWITKLLIERNVKTWIVDPFARAMNGSGDENSNSDVGMVLDSLDVIKGRAGVGELILPTHTGRAEQTPGMERARGATRLDDWADARWLLTTDDQGRRFFRAHGRDVDVDEEMLTFDQSTGRLTMGGHDRRGIAAKDHVASLVDWVREHPGLGKDEIVAGHGGNRNRIYAALSSAVAARLMYTTPAPRGKLLHYVTGAVPSTPGGQHGQ
jgi:hypothetical protein